MSLWLFDSISTRNNMDTLNDNFTSPSDVHGDPDHTVTSKHHTLNGV